MLCRYGNATMGLDTAPSQKHQISNFAKETINEVQHGIKKIVHTVDSHLKRGASHLLHESPSSSSSPAAAAAATATAAANSNTLDPRNESQENDGDLYTCI